MSKRIIEEEEHERPVKGGGVVDGEMGEFEDPWEDEFEEEDAEMGEADGEEGEDEDTEMMDDGAEEGVEVRAYLPGDKLEEGEVLEANQSAYHMLHSINVEWPCLSFDIIPDLLGDNREKFPMTMYAVAGTQADKAPNNKLLLLKMSQMHKTMFDDNSDGEESDEEATDDDPLLETRYIKHYGGVNRVRVNPHNAGIVAVWADTGKVSMYDVSAHVAALDTPPAAPPSSTMDPLYTFSGHGTEGFALDWSPKVPGRFASGDCRKHIYVWDPTEAGSWAVNKVPYNGHEASVEDIQWSPSEANVFASCSVDKTIRIWDARKRQAPALTVTAHDGDVNVINWNRSVNYLLVSGGDDGVIKVWDLRMFPSGKPEPVATFKWHTAPITSVEWHPTEDSVIAVSGADDQTTLWDLSVEPDPEGGEDATLANVPPQLLFIHQGQKDVKEHHWHRQCSGVLITTAGSGFNVFKTISV
eukprot:comp12461_c0_seq1/m.7394 comp12461_c0_seq1/g.7394  ORF comp12461_c0_seq1/g.7394 comp12461_c0_seq1/m.7394 type:complete len:470 (-) comp12461_c0_seq1:240-1649(-)